MSKKINFITIGLLFFPLLGLANNFVGEYECKEINLATNVNDKIHMLIEQSGNTYKITRTMGEQKFIGVGIAQQNVLSIIYQEQQSLKTYGLGQYFQEQGKLVGQWLMYGDNKINSESCFRIIIN